MENLPRLSSLAEGQQYTQLAEFLMDFHTAADAGGAWEPDTKDTESRWWPARTGEGDREIVAWSC